MMVAVVGARGHTGRFVLAELSRRGHVPIAIVRSEAPGAHGVTDQTRVARLDDAAALDRALVGARAVINCAGPFLDTAVPVVEAALRAGIHYADVTAEQRSARSTFKHYAAEARRRDVVLLPAASFFGGLGDLLATATMGDRSRADRIDIAIAIDRWWPTPGTRDTGARNSAPRLVLEDGALVDMPSTPRQTSWRFPKPFETLDVVEVPLSETILISTHLDVPSVRHYMNEAPLRDLSDPATPPPVAVDERGRSTQTFVVDVVVRDGTAERRSCVRGRDIYAVTAPIVVEAVERACARHDARAGTFALGDLFDAGSFLEALVADGVLTVADPMLA